jgi:hypothetical protein
VPKRERDIKLGKELPPAAENFPTRDEVTRNTEKQKNNKTKAINKSMWVAARVDGTNGSAQASAEFPAHQTWW